MREIESSTQSDLEVGLNHESQNRIPGQESSHFSEALRTSRASGRAHTTKHEDDLEFDDQEKCIGGEDNPSIGDEES